MEQLVQRVASCLRKRGEGRGKKERKGGGKREGRLVVIGDKVGKEVEKRKEKREGIKIHTARSSVA